MAQPALATRASVVALSRHFPATIEKLTSKKRPRLYRKWPAWISIKAPVLAREVRLDGGRWVPQEEGSHTLRRTTRVNVAAPPVQGTVATKTTDLGHRSAA